MRLFFVLFFVGVTLAACKNEDLQEDSDKIEACLEPDVKTLLLELDRYFDFFLLNTYGEVEDDLLLARRFLEDWKTDTTGAIFKKIQQLIDEESFRTLINRGAVRKIFDWALHMGDSTWLDTPILNSELVNPLRFNYRGQYKDCLEVSGDSLALAYLSVKELADLQHHGIADFFLYQIEKEISNRKLLRSLILTELYLRPLAIKYLEQ